MEGIKLMTFKEWEKLSPKSQGYVYYMQAECPGSELKGVSNPYNPDTTDFEDFQEGENIAYISVLDMEE